MVGVVVALAALVAAQADSAPARAYQLRRVPNTRLPLAQAELEQTPMAQQRVVIPHLAPLLVQAAAEEELILRAAQVALAGRAEAAQAFKAEALEIRHQYRRHKAQMAATDLIAPRIMAVALVAERLLLAEMEHQPQAAAAEQEQLLAFPAVQ